MLGDDAGAAPPIKGVCRSASIALRKANLAKETGDADEELAQLRSFNRTIANVLRLHPMYARKKQDEEVAGLDAKLPEVRRRIEALGGKVAPPPENVAEAAASVAAARLVAGGGKVSLLERRRLSRAGSRAGSRAASAAPSRDASPERAPAGPHAHAHAHSPHDIVTDLSRRLAAMEQSEKARAAREAETEARLADLARRAAAAEEANRRSDARAETAETLVWELQEALQALSPALQGTESADATRDARVDRLEARIGEVDAAAREIARESARKPSSPTAGRLADLEAQVLPTRVAELEQRVAELAEISAVATSANPASLSGDETRVAPTRTRDPGSLAAPDAARSPGEAFSAETRDLRARVARLEHVDVGSAEWAHAAEAKAATAVARVDALEKVVDAVAKASASRAAPEALSDADTRAAVAALQTRVRRVEAAAAEAMELAATTSPGTARAKSAVPELRNRVTDVEVGVEAASARGSEVETRVNRMSSATKAAEEDLEARLASVAAAARDAAREAPRESLQKPLPKPKSSSEPAAASDRVDPEYLEDTLESLRQARAADRTRVDELEKSVGSAVSAIETLRDVVAAVEARHREAAGEQADAVGEVVAAMGGATAALPKLERRMQALEDARAEHAEALATSAARVAALEADTETASRVSSKLAERARGARAEIGELRETVRQSVSAAAVKTLVAAVSSKVSRLARETADTVDAMKREQRQSLASARARDARPESSQTLSSSGKMPARETEALAEKAAALAEQASERAASACAAAKKAGALAETAAAAPARFAGELADTVESLREARAMDADAAAELERRVDALEAARGAAAHAATPAERMQWKDDTRENKDPPDDEGRGAKARKLDTETRERPDLEPRVDALGAAVASAAEGIAALRERLEELVASGNEVCLAHDLAQPESGGGPVAPNAAAFGAAEATAGAAETLAEAVARLQARMAAVERRSGAEGTATHAQAGAGAGAGASHGSENILHTPDDRLEEDSGGDTADTSGSGPSSDPRAASETRNARGAVAPEARGAAAAAAGGESAEPSDADLVQRAKLAASIARRAVRDEAARLGITLGDEDAGDGDAEIGISAEDASAELTRRAEAATVADRELAAELATVCALVEKEEARRETLRAAFVSAGDASPGGTEPAAADDAVAVAARREWAACMEAQLRRLRAAAREAEARNAAAAEELTRRPGGIGTRSGAMRAARAAGERREAAIADRLARVVRRVDAAFGPEIDGVESFDKENALVGRPAFAPWGAGPGLKAAPSGSKAVSRRHFGSKGVDSALVALERRVDALARAAASGAPMTPTTRAPPGVPPARSALREAPLEGGALELTSLRRMMRAAQTELGALSGRVEAVETKVREAGRLERDLRSARLTEKRAEERQNRTSVERSVAADAARASERAAAAARDVSGLRAQYAEVAESVGSQREGLRRVVSRMDGLARDVDVSARSAEAAADRARAQARSAVASAKSAEARAAALAGALGRVARHVGLRGVGDALRTGVLWEDRPGVEGSGGAPEQEEVLEDRFEITAFANDGA